MQSWTTCKIKLFNLEQTWKYDYSQFLMNIRPLKPFFHNFAFPKITRIATLNYFPIFVLAPTFYYFHTSCPKWPLIIFFLKFLRISWGKNVGHAYLRNLIGKKTTRPKFVKGLSFQNIPDWDWFNWKGLGLVIHSFMFYNFYILLLNFKRSLKF